MLTKFTRALLHLPLRFIPRAQVMTVRRGLNQGYRWTAGAGVHRCWLGTYEPEVQDLMRRCIRPGSVAWDVGAHAGFFTLALAKLVGPGGKVFAFEPSAGNVTHLLAHLTLNGITNATVVQAALAGAPGITGFQVSSSNYAGRLSTCATGYWVPTFDTDGFLAKHPEARPDFIKIDVEGAESALLEGAEHLLREHGPELLVALHGAPQREKCRSILLNHDYTVDYLDGPLDEATGLGASEIHARKQTSATQRRGVPGS